jgi:hypothetical protein
MSTLPATFLQVKAAFILNQGTFKEIATPLGTSSQYVQYVLRVFWQNRDFQPKGVLARKILAATEAYLLSHNGNGLTTPTQVSKNIDIGTVQENSEDGPI